MFKLNMVSFDDLFEIILCDDEDLTLESFMEIIDDCVDDVHFCVDWVNLLRVGDWVWTELVWEFIKEVGKDLRVEDV